MRRLFSAAALALITAPLWPSSPASPTPTARKSVAAPLVVRDRTDIQGVGCGMPASWTLTLPARAFGARVRKPKVGARDGDARLTDVAAHGTAVTFTAVADSQEICDPNASSIPPAQRPWSAGFAFEVAFKRLETVAVRSDWNGRGFLVRPRVVGFNSTIAPTVRNMRWKVFGGRKAVGYGTFRFPPGSFPSPARCPPEGQRVRVELSRPGYCRGDNVLQAGDPVRRFVFYGETAAVNLRRLGVLRSGTKFLAYHPDCGAYGVRPILIR
jgi:hypothetical protein